MRCERARKWVSDELDGALVPVRKSRLERHLAACPACRAYRDDLAVLAAGAKDLPAGDPPPGYWPDFERRLDDRMASLGKPGKRRPAPLFRPRKWAWAGAAFLIMAFVGIYVAFFRPAPEPEEAWPPYGYSMARILQEAEEDPELAMALDREVTASIEDLTRVPGEDFSFSFADEPLFWEGLSEEELRFIASELETENDRGVSP